MSRPTPIVNQSKTIKVPVLTRVEGEGGVTVRLHGQAVEAVELNIFEPPRLFEALLKGRQLEDVPDITARICGICPVAYQMSSVHALERALGVVVTPEIRLLRRLLYCGEWIESHSLHIHLLHAPDFFDAASGIELATRFPAEIRRGIELKKLGNRLLEIVGGRAIHPVNVTVGGFYRVPDRQQLQSLIPDFERGLQYAIDTARWVAEFPFPDLERPYEFVSLQHSTEYPMNEGEIVSSAGLRIPVEDYGQHFAEQQVRYSTALHSVRRESQLPYFVGPLARMNLNRDRLASQAESLANEIGFPNPCRNPFKSIIARSLELVQAFEEALDILRSVTSPSISRVPYQYKRGSGCAATEAPRGMLFHEFTVDEAGKLESGRIIPPTSQNQKQIEVDLHDYLDRRLQSVQDEQQLAIDCERLVRSYDPCISCSTHFLKVRWIRGT